VWRGAIGVARGDRCGADGMKRLISWRGSVTLHSE
jgi:hypothetical protein